MKKAYELIFNADKTKVIDQVELNPDTLKRFHDEYGSTIWVQYNDKPESRRILPRENLLTNF